jgi:hypothetical protein
VQCLVFVDCVASLKQVSLCRGILQKEQVDFCLFISYVYYIHIKDFGHTSFFLDPTVGSGDCCEALRRSSACVLSGDMRCYSSVCILFMLIVTISSSCTYISVELPVLSRRKFLYFADFGGMYFILLWGISFLQCLNESSRAHFISHSKCSLHLFVLVRVE